MDPAQAPPSQPIPPPIAPVQTPQAPVSQPQKRRNWKKIILFSLLGLTITSTLIIIGVAIALFFFMKNNPTVGTWATQLAQDPQVARSLVQNALTPAVKEDTQTTSYVNQTYSVSLTLPASFAIKESTYGLGITRVEMTQRTTTNTARVADIQMLLLPMSLGQLIGQDFNTYFDMQPNETKELSSTQQEGEGQIITKRGNRTVNGLRVVDFTSTSPDAKQNAHISTGSYVEVGKNMLLISAGASKRALLDEILQTIKHPL